MRNVWMVCFCATWLHLGLVSADEGQKLHAIFDSEWDWTMRTHPTWASRLGDLRYNSRWPDLSRTAIRSNLEHQQSVLKQLDAIDKRTDHFEHRVDTEMVRSLEKMTEGMKNLNAVLKDLNGKQVVVKKKGWFSRGD